MRFKYSLEPMKIGFEVAPLIDVVFLLLIFFVLTSSFVNLTSFKVNLPQAVTGKKQGLNEVVITVSRENKIYLGGRELSFSELTAELTMSYNKKVVLEADKEVPLGLVVKVWDLCREKGIKEVNILTER